MVTLPTTRTPLKNTVNTNTNAAFSESNFEAVLQIGNTSVKQKNPTIQKPKNQNIKKQLQDSVDVKSFGLLDFWIFRFWCFRFLDFWNVGFLDACILDP